MGAFFSAVWENMIVEGFRRIAEFFRGLIMLDGDLYFTSKRKDGSPRVFSLYFGLVGAIIIGAFFATLIFVSARAMSDYYINNVYLDAEHKSAREKELLLDLQDFINERGVTVDDAKDTTSGSDGTTWTYEYDLGGNIFTKNRYA